MFSGLFGGGGTAKRAAQVATSKEAEAGQLIKDQYATLSKYYTPYQDAGTGALTQYQNVAATLPQYTDRINNYAVSIDPIMAKIQSNNLNDYQASPGYDFRMQQGQKALEASRAANGTLNSGATGKALLEYGQNFGTAEYDNYLNRLYQQINGVGSQISGVQAGQQSAQGSLDAYGNLINTGYNAANASANLGMNAAQQEAERIANTGQIYAGGMIAKDNQMKASGDQWIKLAAMAAGGAAGGAGGAMMGGSMAPQFAGTGQPQYGTGNQAYIQPYNPPQQSSWLSNANNGYYNGMPQVGVNMPQGANQPVQPWQNPDVARAAQISTQSSYQPRRYLS